MSTIVETGLGKLEGFERDGVRVFRGIPYAKPPVGELPLPRAREGRSRGPACATPRSTAAPRRSRR